MMGLCARRPSGALRNEARSIGGGARSRAPVRSLVPVPQHLSRKSVVAVVAEFGGPASHAALLTREMGIPAVTHVSAACDAIAAGDYRTG